MSEGWELSTKLKWSLYDPCMCVTEVEEEEEEEEEARDRFKHLTHIDRNRHYIRSSSSREGGKENSAEFASPFIITRIFLAAGSSSTAATVG